MSETSAILPRFYEATESSEVLFTGRVVKLTRDTVRLPNQKLTTREVIHHPGGVVALPLLDDGRIVFVQQYRYPLGHMLLELPAGKLEPGEDPLEAIKRELREETQYQAAQWESMSFIYTAPGFCNEKLWLYKASGLKHNPIPGYNTQEHGEFVEPVLLTFDEAIAKVRNGEIVDAKTVSLLAMGFMFFNS